MLAALASTADADRRTTEKVTLRKKPGEKEAALATIPANTRVVVLGDEGRWLRVRVDGRTGYLTRTTVTDSEPPPATAATGAWSAGHAGGVATIAMPEFAAATDSSAAAPAATREDTSTYTRPPRGALVLRADLGLGFRALGMRLSSNANGGLTNYVLDADAAALAFAGDARLALGGRVHAAADVRFVASDASPGITYNGPSGPPGTIPFRTLELDAGVRGGVRVHDGIDVALRLGGHYDAFLPTSVDNAGMLPRERLVGATAGLRADLAPPHSRFGATARFDVLVVGSRAQTSGLEDGQASTAHALWGGASVRCAVGEHVVVFVAYDFERATTDWTGMSVREPTVTDTSRTDTAQLLQIGVGAEL